MTMAQDHVFALNPSNYPSTPHNRAPANEVDKAAHKTSMYLLSHHRIAPSSIGHFWYLQFGIKLLEDQGSRTTMLLGLSSLMDILPEAIKGFALHPLDKKSMHPALTNNIVEDGFLSSAVLAFKYFHVKDKQNRAAGQLAVALPQQPFPFKHNN